MIQTDKDHKPDSHFGMLDCAGHVCDPPVPPQDPAPQHSLHSRSPQAHRFLLLRNCAVVSAAVLFGMSLFFVTVGQDLSFRLKAIAYFIGAAAYGCEYLMLTDFRRHKPPHREMLMSNVFGIMYIIMGISYFIH